jgi:polyisoprenoid-binding protein YceI
METSAFPAATFKLTKPIELGSVPALGESGKFDATGLLTLHGVARSVSFEVTAARTSSGAQVVGSIPIEFNDWGISNPSFGPVTTEDHGVLEFSLDLAKA